MARKMEVDTLNVSGRTETGKGPNRRLRVQGMVPAIIYGTGEQPQMVSLSFRELEKALSKANAETNLFHLTGKASGGDNVTVVIRELQRDPLTRRYLHVDFLHVRMDQAAEFEVPIHTIGTPVGVREGGIMETHRRMIEVRCLPGDLPEEIIVDIAGIPINETFHVSDLKLPDNVAIVTDPEETLFAVHAARKATAEETAEDEAAKQPEVVGKPEEPKES